MMLLDLSGSERRLSEFTIPDSADWTFAGDFTIELFQVKFAAVAQARLIGQYNATGNQRSWVIMYQASTNELWFNASLDGSAALQAIYPWTPTVATPYDIAVDRDGTTVRLYVDGVKVANVTVSGALKNSTDVVSVGAGRSGAGFTETFTGTCRAARVTAGVARYATDTSYTVPSLPLPTG